MASPSALDTRPSTHRAHDFAQAQNLTAGLSPAFFAYSVARQEEWRQLAHDAACAQLVAPPSSSHRSLRLARLVLSQWIRKHRRDGSTVPAARVVAGRIAVLIRYERHGVAASDQGEEFVMSIPDAVGDGIRGSGRDRPRSPGFADAAATGHGQEGNGLLKQQALRRRDLRIVADEPGAGDGGAIREATVQQRRPCRRPRPGGEKRHTTRRITWRLGNGAGSCSSRYGQVRGKCRLSDVIRGNA